jgi:hypothetical protein
MSRCSSVKVVVFNEYKFPNRQTSKNERAEAKKRRDQSKMFKVSFQLVQRTPNENLVTVSDPVETIAIREGLPIRCSSDN